MIIANTLLVLSIGLLIISIIQATQPTSRRYLWPTFLVSIVLLTTSVFTIAGIFAGKTFSAAIPCTGEFCTLGTFIEIAGGSLLLGFFASITSVIVWRKALKTLLLRHRLPWVIATVCLAAYTYYLVLLNETSFWL